MDSRFEYDELCLPLDPDSVFSKTEQQPRIFQQGSLYEKPLALDMPYPPTDGAAPNEKYAELIRGSFSGRESEMTAVMNCVYHGMRFCQSCPELSQTLIGIALCELRHFIILGKLLLALGSDPKFFCCLPTNSNAGGWWSAHPLTVNYRDSIDKALQNGIAAEKAAIAEYQSIAKYADDDCVRAVLKRITGDEELHLETLKCLYSRFCS